MEGRSGHRGGGYRYGNRGCGVREWRRVEISSATMMYGRNTIEENLSYTGRSVRKLCRLVVDQVGEDLKVRNAPEIHIQIESRRL
jgi:hypothetical protein